MREPLDFDDGKGFLLRSAVRHIDDFSLQKVPSMEFPENLGRIGDIHVAYSKIDPSVSHIGKAVVESAGSAASFCEAFSTAYARARRGALWLLSTEKNGPPSTPSHPPLRIAGASGGKIVPTLVPSFPESSFTLPPRIWGKSNSCRSLPRASPSQNLTRKPVFESMGRARLLRERHVAAMRLTVLPSRGISHMEESAGTSPSRFA